MRTAFATSLLLVAALGNPFLPLTNRIVAQEQNPGGQNKLGTELTVGTAWSGQLTPGEFTVAARPNVPCKLLLANVTAGQRYKIDLDTSEFRPLLQLEDPKGKVVLFAGGPAGSGALVIFTPTQTGAYRIIMTSDDAKAKGKFTLLIAPLEPGVNPAPYKIHQAMVPPPPNLKLPPQILPPPPPNLKLPPPPPNVKLPPPPPNVKLPPPPPPPPPPIVKQPPPPKTPAEILAGSWVGGETLKGYGRLEFNFNANGNVVMIDLKETTMGQWNSNGQNIDLLFYKGTVLYKGTINGRAISGTATNARDNWTWSVSKK